MEDQRKRYLRKRWMVRSFESLLFILKECIARIAKIVVKLNKKIAVVSLYKDVDESLIKDTIEKLDFTVVGME